MPFNGSGTFNLIYNWQNDAAQSLNISSSRMQGQDADIAGGLSLCITKDGQQTPTANLPMGGFRFTNMGNASATGNATSLTDVQNATLITLASVAGTDTITGTVTPAIGAYAAGQSFEFIAAGANATNAVTLNIGALGAIAVLKAGASGLVQLSPGDLQTGQSVRVRYDGTQFQVVSFIPQSSAFGFRNYLINGNFDNWERGTSFSYTASGGYTADRWTASSGTGGAAACTVSRAAVGPGGEIAGAAPIRFALNFQQTGAATATNPGLTQKIESVKALQGRVVTLSFIAYLVSGSTLNVAPALAQFFGTGGSPSASVTTNFSNFSVTTTPQKFTGTLTLPGISGKTLGSNGDDALWLIFTLPGATTFNLIIEQVQVEQGASATPFEIRPRELELALCQRFFASVPSLATTTANSGAQTLPVKMRATPAISSAVSAGSGATFSMLLDANTSTSQMSFYQNNANSALATASIKFDADL